jgi:hypothetical protein
MKKIFVIIAALFISAALYAQVHVNINIGSQPPWGLSGYDYVENYYLPDIQVYYNVPLHRFYYYEGGRWIGRAYLPPAYRHYDLYHSRRIVINDRQPWRYHETYRDRYSDDHDSRYYQQPKHDNGKHLGWYKGNNGNGNNDKGHGNNGKGHGNGKGRGK